MTHSPIAYSLAGAAAASGLSKSTLERHIREGRLRAKKSSVDSDGNPCGNWVILHSSLEAFIDGLVDA